MIKSQFYNGYSVWMCLNMHNLLSYLCWCYLCNNAKKSIKLYISNH